MKKNINKDNLMEGVNKSLFIVLVLVFFIVFGIAGYFIAVWANLGELAGRLLLGGMLILGQILFYILVFPHLQHESKSTIQYKESLIPETKQKLEALDKQEDKKRNIEGIVLTLFVLGCLSVFGYSITRGNGETLDIVTIASFCALPLGIVSVFTYLGIKGSIANKKLPPNPMTATGTVHRCRHIMANNADELLSTHVFEVLITVSDVNTFLRATITTGTSEPPYEAGQEVAVAFDFTKPKYCKIIENYIPKN